MWFWKIGVIILLLLCTHAVVVSYLKKKKTKKKIKETTNGIRVRWWRSASVLTGDGYVEERFSGRSAAAMAAAACAASDNRGESRATTFHPSRPASSSTLYALVRFLSSFALLPRARRNAGSFGLFLVLNQLPTVRRYWFRQFFVFMLSYLITRLNYTNNLNVFAVIAKSPRLWYLSFVYSILSSLDRYRLPQWCFFFLSILCQRLPEVTELKSTREWRKKTVSAG